MYIHIPFCIKKCRYCDFYSTGDAAALGDKYIGALVSEWARVKDNNTLHDVVIDTLYFGGGTPSMLSPVQWERIHREFTSRLILTPCYEWSVEANPDSFTPELAGVWRDIGVNRVTLGIQSLDDRELRFLGRPHDAGQAIAALDRACDAGFASVGADVMYGLPGQSTEGLTRTLSRMLEAGINHLSAYELTLADDTPLGRHQRILPMPEEDTVIGMGEVVAEECARHGLSRYEISNYAQQGHESRHNNAYWAHKPFIGLGPSAHSYLHPYRWANIADTRKYIKDVGKGGTGEAHRETIGQEERVEECIFLGLRTVRGIDGARFMQLTGEQFDSGKRCGIIRRLISSGKMTLVQGCYALTPDGMLLTDAITRDLI